MRIELLNTGTELLLGTTLNTHGQWIGQELQKRGLRLQRQVTVPDGDIIEHTLREAIERSDAVIVTGGLGPTSDDVTREATAKVLGVEMIEDEEAWRTIHEFFKVRGYGVPPEGNRKQAMSPVGSDILPNPNGTAPGIYTPPRMSGEAACAVFLLPGPPRELQPMFSAEVLPRLEALSGGPKGGALTELKFVGIGESSFHEGVDEQLQQMAGLEFGYCARLGELDLRLIGTPEVTAEARRIVEASFASYLISDDGKELPEVVVEKCRMKGLTLAAAESCTGGLIASRVTDVPGASAVLTHGFVTYSNEAKCEMLGVEAALIEKHGAVSEEVCRAMVAGALEKSGSDFAIAVTGIAGPGGGSKEKPVGTVCIGIGRKGGEIAVQTQCHPRGRRSFKQQVSQVALDLLRRAMDEKG